MWHIYICIFFVQYCNFLLFIHVFLFFFFFFLVAQNSWIIWGRHARESFSTSKWPNCMAVNRMQMSQEKTERLYLDSCNPLAETLPGSHKGLQSLQLPPDFHTPASSDNKASKHVLRSAFKSGWHKSPSVFVYVFCGSPMGTVAMEAWDAPASVANNRALL